MKAMIDFFRTMSSLPKPWVVWVMLLMTANMIIPLFYVRTPEGKIVIARVPMVFWLWSRRRPCGEPLQILDRRHHRPGRHVTPH